MAIYRKGQASMDADGYITGYGTNWKTALTLIRPGATIVFATNPVAYATISEIINDTSLRATSTGGAVVPQGDYVILLHDSITVDGLAQDVAETLRYYQGQETMYQGFVDFLKTFDWEKLEAIDAGVKDNAAAAAASESASKQSETNAAASAAASDASKNESQAAAAISTNARNEANASKDAAAQSAASAKSDADRAADLADQLDATNLMRKDANLSDVADRRSAVNNLGLGEAQAVTFSRITSKQWNGSNGGILISDNINSSGERVSQSRFYSEVQGGICKTTIYTSGNGKKNYVQINEDGSMSGLQDILVAGTARAGLLRSNGDVWAAQGNSVGVLTTDGGNKNIFLQNIAGDGNPGSWVNLLQGNWYGGYWQIGGVRGGSSDIDHFKIGVNNQGSDWKEFKFHNSYGGHITAQRGFKGQCIAGGWTLDSEYMGAPFYADTATNNDGGYSPVVAGGTRASTGYDIRYSFGAMSGGAGNWSRAVIHMLGDATHHRAFEFFVDGRIYTWDNDNQWGGAFEFQRVATSDRDLKKDIEYNDGKASFDNIMKFKPSTFVYKSDKYNRLRRGVIAQDLYEIDPEYVRIIPGSPIIDNDAGTDEEGKPVIMDYNDDTLGLDNNVIMIDTALATRYIGGIVEKQQEEIDNLKYEIEELRSMISKLIEK